MPTTDKEKTPREGPNPNNILLTALKRAVTAGVDRAQLGFALDMAITATLAPGDGSPRKQSDAFKQVAGTLNGWSEAMQSGNGAQPAQTEVTVNPS